jgi:hypothetical protein
MTETGWSVLPSSPFCADGLYTGYRGVLVPYTDPATGSRTLLAPSIGGLIERYAGCPRCMADIDASGAVTLQDLFTFLNQWFGGTRYADIDASGQVSVEDLLRFIQEWLPPCTP